MLDAKIVRKSIKRWPEKLQQVNRQFLPIAKTDVVETAQRAAPRDQSILVNSIKGRIDGNRVIVGTNVEYAPHVEYGTRPHFIGSPVKTRKGWRYIGNHPGTQAQSFMRVGIDKNRKRLVKLWAQIFRKVYGR